MYAKSLVLKKPEKHDTTLAPRSKTDAFQEMFGTNDAENRQVDINSCYRLKQFLL